MFIVRKIAAKQWATLTMATLLAVSAQLIPLDERSGTSKLLASQTVQLDEQKQPDQS